MELSTKNLALIPTAYTGSNGNLGVLIPQHGKSGIKWYSCREEFNNAAWEGSRSTLHEGGFLFYHNAKVTAYIAEFIDRFESLMEQGRHKPMIRSKIQKVNTYNVIKGNDDRMTWCEPGPFWFKQPMRFSLFSMLLRCANNGYVAGGEGDFWAALFCGYDLARGCKASIARFLDAFPMVQGQKRRSYKRLVQHLPRTRSHGARQRPMEGFGSTQAQAAKGRDAAAFGRHNSEGWPTGLNSVTHSKSG